jgi:biopolymer transport protein ExbD
MKFPRNARIIKGQLDATPFVTVFFLLVLFQMLSSLVYTPGVSLNLPVADTLPGTDQRTVAVAMDAGGRLYFENQLIRDGEQFEQFTNRLSQEVLASDRPLTLLVRADKATSYETLIRLTTLASKVGITNVLLATLPRPMATWAPRAP